MEEIPALGFGTWKISKDTVEFVVYEAIKTAGVRHIDCACDYGNEVEVGRGIKRAIDEGIVSRNDLWITSKLWNTYHRKEHVSLACEKSLSDLQISYFDLYLIHFPIPQKFVPIELRYPPEWIHDPLGPNPRIELDLVPYSETWRAMEDLVKAGKTKYIGVCNLTVLAMMDLLSYAKIKPYTNQVEIHPYLQQHALVDFCKSFGVRITAFSPLGSPSYVQLNMDKGLGGGVLSDAIVTELANKYNKSPAQVVLR